MYSKGISWINDCRIPFVDEVRTIPVHSKDEKDDKTLFGLHPTIQRKRVETTQGRFPANILVCDDMLNDGIVYSSGSGDGKLEMININDAHHYNYINTNRKIKKMTGLQYNDKGSNSRYYDIDKWFNNLIE